MSNLWSCLHYTLLLRLIKCSIISLSRCAIFVPNSRCCFLPWPHLEIDNDGIPKKKLYDKRDDFTFPIVIFPFISHNIPESPAYGVYPYVILEFVPSTVILSCWRKRYSNKATLLLKLKSLEQKIYGRHHNLVDRYKYTYLKWQWIFYFYP